MYIFLRRQQNTRLLQLETPGHQCGEPNSSNIWINMVMPSGTPTIRTLQDIINTYKYLDLKKRSDPLSTNNNAFKNYSVSQQHRLSDV